jgi:hypothetical protein
MMPTQHWARSFTVERDDLEFLTSLLLERETPLETEILARALVQEKIDRERAVLRDRYKGARIYDPAQQYAVGERLIFTEFDFATAEIKSVRVGNNPDYGEFAVAQIRFDDNELNSPRKLREFAIALQVEHDLNQEDQEVTTIDSVNDLSLDEVMAVGGKQIIAKVEEKLRSNNDLIYMARRWFPRDLLMDVNIGHLNLAEAVLDISGGGPMPTEQILDEIGGLGKAPQALQTFSMNYALNQDSRFDEVGPAGEVLWHLTRLEPADVQTVPALLRYTTIEYDRDLLTDEMRAMEAEIDDELSDAVEVDENLEVTTVTLTYPHRRLGTLPLSERTAVIFPTARQTPRVSCVLIDGQDGEEYPAWVVRKERYVYGLAKFYRKHKLPIGAYVTISKSDQAGKVIVDFKSHKPRTEWIRLIVPKGDSFTFENQKRAIGAEYDELMILGADELAAVDAVVQVVQQQRKNLVAIMRNLIPALGTLTPQGTVHSKTLYSAVNVLRRCPPGAIFAVLAANPDFQNVGGEFWKLSGD